MNRKSLSDCRTNLHVPAFLRDLQISVISVISVKFLAPSNPHPHQTHIPSAFSVFKKKKTEIATNPASRGSTRAIRTAAVKHDFVVIECEAFGEHGLEFAGAAFDVEHFAA